MKHLLTLLATLTILVSPAAAQTIKSLGYNTTNGQIVAATNPVWTNAFSFSTNTVAAQVRTNVGLGATWLTNETSPVFSPTITNITGSTSNIVLESARSLQAVIGINTSWGTNTITLPTNAPQHGDLVSMLFFRSGGLNPAIVTHAGGLGGPWYLYVGSEARWIYDTNAGPARWQQLGRTVRAQITYLADSVSDTRANLGLGLGLLTNASITNFQAALFSTNTAPANTTNVSAWATIQIGTNAIRVPLYQ